MMLQRKELHVVKTIVVPDDRLNESRFSDSVVIEATDINAPQGITSHGSEGRNSIHFTLHRLIERWLPVRFDCVREGQACPVVLEPATVLVRAKRYGRSLETHGAHVFRLDADARIVEAWGFTVDQAALDALLDPS